MGRRPIAIFAVDAYDVRSEQLNGFDGITGAVEDHVGRVEIYFQIRPVYIGNKTQQHRSGLLTRFKSKRLTEWSAVITNIAGSGKHFGIERIGGVMRHKTDVAGDAGDAKLGT